MSRHSRPPPARGADPVLVPATLPCMRYTRGGRIPGDAGRRAVVLAGLPGERAPDPGGAVASRVGEFTLERRLFPSYFPSSPGGASCHVWCSVSTARSRPGRSGDLQHHPEPGLAAPHAGIRRLGALEREVPLVPGGADVRVFLRFRLASWFPSPVSVREREPWPAPESPLYLNGGHPSFGLRAQRPIRIQVAIHNSDFAR